MVANAIDIRPLTGALGCEIDGVDLRAPLCDESFAVIHRALLDYSVIVLRDQHLRAEDLARFAQRFGRLEDEPFIPHKTDTPGVFQLKGVGSARLSTQNLGWHVDHSYQRNPSLGAVLLGVDVPATGGDTLFANMCLAYETLSAEMQDFVSGLTAIHDVLHYGLQSGHYSAATSKGLARMTAMRERFPPIEHPLVCTHPETGRRILYINQAWTTSIKDLEDGESRAMLAILNAHAVQPEAQCRVKWRNGMVTMWDNRCVQHRPTSDYEEDRLMLRVAIHSDWEPR